MTCDQARSLDWSAYAADPAAPEFTSFRRHYPTCVECAREVARVTRLEWALRDQASQDAHPDPDALFALEHRPASLDAGEREWLAAHLAGCAACRSELAALRGFDFARLQAAASPSGRAPARRPRWLRSLAVAAGLALVATSLLLVRERIADTGGSDDVAIAPPEPPSPALAPAPPEAEQPVVAAREPEQPTVAAREPTPPAAAPAPAPEPQATEPAAPEPPAPAPPAREQHAARSAETPAPPVPAPRAVEPSPAPAPPAPARGAAVFPAEPLVYAHAGPTDPALARLRVPTVVRGAGGSGARIVAFAPDHVGLTAEASPTLYWFLAEPTRERIDLVVTDERAEQPLLDRSLDGAKAGIHAIDLSRAGVRLEPGVTYRWYASVVPDDENRTSEMVSGGAIRRVAMDPALRQRLAQAGEGERAHLLAAGGLFYDALAAVSTSIARHPDAPEPRRDRRALLAAVGLEAALPDEPTAAP